MKVELILDTTIVGQSQRLTLFRVTYPRIVHAELLRHRQFSICSASSRAIPFDRMVDQYCNFYPEKWRAHQAGMQPNEEYMFSMEELNRIEGIYDEARSNAIRLAGELQKCGVAKEQINRLIEPFSNITHLMQGTERAWEAFFALRCDKNAQYEIRQLAIEIERQYRESKPVVSDTHIPFITDEERILYNMETMMMVSSARCARTSFYNHEGKQTTLEEDLKLANSLLQNKHMSPFEFPVMGLEFAYFKLMSDKLQKYVFLGHPDSYSEFNFSGNLNTENLVEYRKILEAEVKV